MNNVHIILERYQVLEEQIQRFIVCHSSLKYVDGSVEVVDGGAYEWSELAPAEREIQIKLISDYSGIIEEMCLGMPESSSELQRFIQSCGEVLSYIRQDSMCWDSSLQKSFENIQRELKLQKQLITIIQPMPIM
ncbi:hypothetical protein EJP77_14490 [Paenibacillus zeisoli]|uniref:Uncharacterized protein n=1 Tax=Paenibacillus zeisoli TaxID=2496267 RepID=A0A3S1DVV8_9BACL|nr:hypothetical protein [Paenibacillus zeisoli]RUT29583.1 hypothetical protein EJP77_14490 [Paenibacillus zeisoli]